MKSVGEALKHLRIAKDIGDPVGIQHAKENLEYAMAYGYRNVSQKGHKTLIKIAQAELTSLPKAKPRLTLVTT